MPTLMIEEKKVRELAKDIVTFNIKTYAVLIDETSRQETVPVIADLKCTGYYTFSLDLAETQFNGSIVKLLPAESKPPECDGWLLGTNSKVYYALTSYLLDNHKEEQVILPLIDKNIASIFSYLDFFKGETESRLYLANIFERTYGIHLPIAIRYILKDCQGNVILSGQKIIHPNHTVVFDSREMDIPYKQFMGYLEIHASLRSLNSEISFPFYHMYIDYLSKDYVASLHQSGLKPQKANLPFYRGFFPKDKEHRLVTSLFNKYNAEPIQPLAHLEYSQDGKRKIAERKMQPVPYEHMVFEDISALFADILSENTKDYSLCIIADKDMHRPNFYINSKNKMMSWLDVEHGNPYQKKGTEDFISKSKLAKLDRYKSHPWHNDIPILPKHYNIDTVILYFGEAPIPFNEFTFIFYDQNGRMVFERDEYVPNHTFINLTKYMKKYNITLDSSMLSVIPQKGLDKIANYAHFKVGFQHHNNPYLVTNIAGGNMKNTAFDYKGGTLWKHAMLPIENSQQFSKVVFSEEYDTIITLLNSSTKYRYDQKADVEIDLYSWDGRLSRFGVEILPNIAKTFSASELLKTSKSNSMKDYFTIWFNCRSNYIRGYNLLHRKTDDAISVEHFYYGRFNSIIAD